jgi:hypothetical protein
VDGKNNVKISTSFLKSEDGGAWSVRVEGEAIEEGELHGVWVCGSDEGRETVEDELDLPLRLGGTWAASSRDRRGRFGEYEHELGCLDDADGTRVSRARSYSGVQRRSSVISASASSTTPR